MLRSHISNRFLKEEKVITAKTQWELDQKINKQRKLWRDKEKRIKEQMNINQMKNKAHSDSEAALELIMQFKNLLKSSSRIRHQINWNEMYKNDPFKQPEPTLQSFIDQVNVPKENKFIEFIFSSVRNKRLEKEKEAEKLYNQAIINYQYKRNKFYNALREHNQSVDSFKQAYEEKVVPFVERYFRTVLDKSKDPIKMKRSFDVQYLSETKILLINYDLPSREAVPDIIEYKFIQSRKEILVKTMKQKDFQEYYEDVLYQLTLKAVYECFSADYADSVDLIVFNGWVHGVDSATGENFHSCIMSLQAHKEQFLALNLGQVVPKECFRKLKGINAGALYQFAPVRPIMEINREDKRFIESKQILAELHSIPNLAEMPWDDFEHLVRELFEQYFSNVGAEVKVTRSSRDGGIDAVAIDPDPIRGGKFIIQAKCYNIVVPISAVRELNGVMADEGAAKGILVTTSYFGNDSWEFVKDKPITLLDGPNLIKMFQDYGYKVRIDLKKKEKAN